MRMQEVQSIVVMCESEMGGLQSCNRWKIVYSAAMQSSSQFFTLKRRAQRLLPRFSASGVLDGDLGWDGEVTALMHMRPVWTHINLI